MKSRWHRHAWFKRGLYWSLGGIFLYAGIVKLLAPQTFADSIADFRMLPVWMVTTLALTLPCLEILIAVMMFTGWRRRTAALAIGISTTVFIVALLSALVRRLNVDCGCFSAGTPSRWKSWTAVGRDVLIVAAAARLYFIPDGNEADLSNTEDDI